MLRNSDERYGLVAKVLHWLVALLIIGLIWLGWYMVDLSYFDKWYNTSLATHKSAGMVTLALGCVQVSWALYDRSPAFADTVRQWERMVAKGGHVTLYIMMILIPFTGYAISTSAGSPIPFFGLFDIPAVLPQGERLRDLAIELHYYSSYGTALLVAIHALAALKHQFVDKDGTLSKML